MELASQRAIQAGLVGVARFQTGDIYGLSLEERFDCIVLCGVLHHLPDPAKALRAVSPLADDIIIMEPNGANPVLKIIEKTSPYHIEHEERSFLLPTIRRWLREAGFGRFTCNHVNLVPMMCPDWMAKLCKAVEPMVEAIPLVRSIACGQYIILARKG